MVMVDDPELDTLRYKAKYVGDRVTREQEFRLLLVDIFMAQIDEILSDRYMNRMRSLVLTPMWTQEERANG